MPAFENLRVNPFRSDRSKTVAFISCKINTELGAMYLNNMTLVNGSNGIFLSFPSRKLPKPDAKGNEYQNHYFMSRDLKEPLQAQAIEEYHRAISGGGGGEYGGGFQGQQGGGGFGGQQQGSGYGTPQQNYGNPPVGNEDDIPF